VDFCGFHYENGTCRPIGRTETIRDWPTPKNVTQLRSFLGQSLQFRDNVPRYSHHAAPLYASTGKSWTWTPQQNRAFQELKNAICHSITTQRYEPTKPSELISDASLFAAAAQLRQEGRIIGIWSRAFTPAERNYTANDRELLAVVEALLAWQHLLENSPAIHVKTDNMINATNIKPSVKNRRINRWILILAEYPLTWHHIPGADNPADVASRRVDYNYK